MAGRESGAGIAPLIAGLERVRLRSTTERLGLPADLEALRPRVAALVADLRGAFEGDPEERRAAFRALLGERKMRVVPDPARGFRVEGVFGLPLETTLAWNPSGFQAS